VVHQKISLFKYTEFAFVNQQAGKELKKIGQHLKWGGSRLALHVQA